MGNFSSCDQKIEEYKKNNKVCRSIWKNAKTFKELQTGMDMYLKDLCDTSIDLNLNLTDSSLIKLNKLGFIPVKILKGFEKPNYDLGTIEYQRSTIIGLVDMNERLFKFFLDKLKFQPVGSNVSIYSESKKEKIKTVDVFPIIEYVDLKDSRNDIKKYYNFDNISFKDKLDIIRPNSVLHEYLFNKSTLLTIILNDINDVNISEFVLKCLVDADNEYYMRN